MLVLTVYIHSADIHLSLYALFNRILTIMGRLE